MFCPEDSNIRRACNTSMPDTSLSLVVLDSPALTSAGNTLELMSMLFRGTILESCAGPVIELKSNGDFDIGLETLCVDMVTVCVPLVWGKAQRLLDGSERPGVVIVLELTTVLDEGGSNVGQVTGGTIDSVGVIPGTSGVREGPNLMVFVLETRIGEVNVAILTGATIDGVGDEPRTPDNRGPDVVMAFVLKTGGLDTESLITDDS